MRNLFYVAVVVSLFVVRPVFAMNETQGERYYFDECGELIGEDYWYCGNAGVDHYGDYSDISREFVWQRCDFQPFSCDDVGLDDRCGWCVTAGYSMSIMMHTAEDPCGW